VCAHYFAVFECSTTAKSHIGLVNPRWYIDDVSLANAETESTISATGEVENSMAVPILINALKQVMVNQCGNRRVKNGVLQNATLKFLGNAEKYLNCPVS
jgi:hypothetical protein